jgi:hypothetical protein
MSDDTNKSVTPETQGQNDAWPGEKLRTPGVKDETTEKVGDMTLKEKTVLPVMPNHPIPTDPA